MAGIFWSGTKKTDRAHASPDHPRRLRPGVHSHDRDWRYRLRHVSAVALTFALVVIGAALPAQTAHAGVILGPGFAFDGGRSIFGGYLAPNGSIAYCLEWGKPGPTNSTWVTSDQGPRGNFSGWGELEVARINYVVTTWGQTADPVQAAAVAVTIWSRHAQSQGGKVSDFSDGHPFVFQALPDPGIRARVFALRNEMMRAADAYTPVAMRPHGEIGIEPSAEGYDRGWVTVSGLEPVVTGTLTLTGAIFDVTGSSSITGAVNGSRYSITYDMTDDRLANVSATAHGSFIMPGRPGSEINLWTTPPSAQTIGTPTPKITDYSFSLSREGEPRDLRFAPIVQTQVPTELVHRGEAFADTVFLSLAQGSLPWRRLNSGVYVPITAWCQAYGPLLAPPERSSLPDPSVPLFGERVLVTTEESATAPWEIPLDVRFGSPAQETGYYTYVCGVDSQQQQDPRSAEVIPPDYRYQHDYGLVEETQVTPMQLRFETQVSAQTVSPGSSIADLITPRTENGGWIADGDGTIPLELEGTAYFSETLPEVSAEAPENAEILDVQRITIFNPDEILSNPIPTPYREGWVTVQWCVHPDSQVSRYSHLIEDWCDDYGVPSETVQLEWPTVTTTSTSQVYEDGQAHDTAEVSGTMPENPDLKLSLSFELYRHTDASRQSVHGGTEIASVCEPENLMSTTNQEGLTVSGPGTYAGDPVPINLVGTYYWVETLRWTDALTLETGIAHRGECGLPLETTVVHEAPALAATAGTTLLPVGLSSGAVLVIGGAWVLISHRVRRRGRDVRI